MPLILRGKFIAIELLVPEEDRGGFARTFKARDLEFPRQMRVIKQLDPINYTVRLNPEQLQRIEEMFREEASTLAELNHPQIPKAWSFFHKDIQDETGYSQRLFYLVQDYIEGKNLNQELSLRNPENFSETEVIKIFKEILHILKYIHNYDGIHGVIHRDIKPANIMRCSQNGRLYLIDFGAVKQTVQGLPVDTSSIVLTPAFAPPEQSSGEPVSPASDLYALATTCLCLLTGNRNPRELIWSSRWSDHVKINNQRFAKALDKMLQYRKEDRPQSAQEVLDILEREKSWFEKFLYWLQNFFNRFRRIPSRWTWVSFGLLVLLGVAIAVFASRIKPPIISPPTPTLVVTTTPRITQSPTPVANDDQDDQYFSRGERSLIPELNNNDVCRTAYELKQEGMRAFKAASLAGDQPGFAKAQTKFKESIRSEKNNCIADPETRIYEYNSIVAQIDLQSGSKFPTLAIVTQKEEISNNKAEDEKSILGLEILRGIAQALDTNQPLFQILLANYEVNQGKDIDNLDEIAQYIANNQIPKETRYFSQSKILGVIGRYISKDIGKIGETYGNKQVVLIAPTSTAFRDNLASDDQPLNEYVFRTASNDSIASENLAKYVQSQANWNKLLMIYDENDKYSESLKTEFISNLSNRKKIYFCNLETSNAENQQLSKSRTCSREALNKKVDVLMLAPPPKYLRNAIDVARDVKVVRQRIQLIGGDVLYDYKTLQELGDSAEGMVIAISSHVSLASQDFLKTAKTLWRTTDVSWRTITSYDAVKVFNQALTELGLNNNLTGQDIYSKLSEPNFSATGATAKIQFYDSGESRHDRKQLQGVGILVQVKKISDNEYRFSTLPDTPAQQ